MSVLALHTMRFADELVDAGDARAPQAEPQAASKREIEMAGELVESLHEDFDPTRSRTATASACSS